jgi:ubiquinone/menaquinone biosynthesis C-methylase UbiE
MKKSDRVTLFDEWADHYDRSVEGYKGFPFEGYEEVLETVTGLARAGPGMAVLDLGIGTGKLAERFVGLGCSVWGLDFSPRMLAKAHARLPQVELIKADLRGDWPLDIDQHFDRVVSGYVLHEFDLASKVRLLKKLANRHLVEGGRIVVGDICFPTAEAREEACRGAGDKSHGDDDRSVTSALWDEDECYWAADEAVKALEDEGLRAEHTQVSFCGGVFVIEPAPGDGARS